jgi:hypothetical protein
MAAKPAKKSSAKGAKGEGKACAATRVASGRSIHATPINPGLTWARRGREVYNAIVADLGGPDLQSELATQTIRRAVGLIVMAEQAEAQLAAGEKIEIEKHISVINAFNRTAGALGLQRQAKDITPSLHELLAEKVAARMAQEAAKAQQSEELEDSTADE